MKKGALYGLCESCGFEGRCGIVSMNFDGTQLLPKIRVTECSIFFLKDDLVGGRPR